MKRGTVLFVDDELNVLDSIRRLLRNEPYESLFAQSSREALDILNTKSVQVIITDLGMPEINGLTLLTKVQQKYPDTIRLVLSGLDDKQCILDAVNRGDIYRYIMKPCTDMDLKVTIKQSIEKYETQKRLELLANLIENAGYIMIFITKPNGELIGCNALTRKTFGHKEDEISILNMRTLFQWEAYRGWDEISALVKRESQWKGELFAIDKNGREFPVDMTISRSENQGTDDGDKIIFLASVRDVTDRHKVERQLKDALREKELLLEEIHHRVKNNMQVIASLLRNQYRTVKNKKYHDMFKDSENRIMSMALVHEKLYQADDLARIDFNNYIRNLISNLYNSMEISPQRIYFKIESEDIFLGIDVAIPCGLIINELVSNCLKHAFPNEREGQIRIALSHIDENEFELRVWDNGIGIPEHLNFRKTESLGLQLVTGLAETQLQGTIDFIRMNGTEFRIRFMDLKYKKRIHE
ncbi:MAG: histidine kinase dimerization/phosphoacceptor domain -containing protein [Thermodesulfobacteriota bacterium]|nr:histidine kinase dimerization/phosphoacceptor domain -containing protein [Thermodesulfobacteriota bacterium]